MNQLTQVLLVIKGRGPDQAPRKERADKGVSRGGDFKPVYSHSHTFPGQTSASKGIYGKELRIPAQSQSYEHIDGELGVHHMMNTQGNHFVTMYNPKTNTPTSSPVDFNYQPDAHNYLRALGVNNPVTLTGFKQTY